MTAAFGVTRCVCVFVSVNFSFLVIIPRRPTMGDRVCQICCELDIGQTVINYNSARGFLFYVVRGRLVDVQSWIIETETFVDIVDVGLESRNLEARMIERFCYSESESRSMDHWFETNELTQFNSKTKNRKRSFDNLVTRCWRRGFFFFRPILLVHLSRVDVLLNLFQLSPELNIYILYAVSNNQFLFFVLVLVPSVCISCDW